MSLQPGTSAPDFTIPDQNGLPVSLHDFRGRKLALYFYPKDDTPGCTAQACNLRDHYELLQQKGIVVLGVSTDPELRHKKFREKYGLPFSLLADPEKILVQAYDVWGEKKFMGRSFLGTHRVTYLINEQGIIDRVIDSVKTKDHTAQILEAWGL